MTETAKDPRRYRLRPFAGRTARAFDPDKLPLSAEVREAVDAAVSRADRIEVPKERRFVLVGTERDRRNGFDGIMTRETCTRAASPAALEATLPRGKIALVGEGKSRMARVVPHMVREEIPADRFAWAVVGGDEGATIDTPEARRAASGQGIEAGRRPFLACPPGRPARALPKSPSALSVASQ